MLHDDVEDDYFNIVDTILVITIRLLIMSTMITSTLLIMSRMITKRFQGLLECIQIMHFKEYFPF